MTLLSSIMEFLAVFVAAYKGIPAGDRWISFYTAAVKQNAEGIKANAEAIGRIEVTLEKLTGLHNEQGT